MNEAKTKDNGLDLLFVRDVDALLEAVVWFVNQPRTPMVEQVTKKFRLRTAAFENLFYEFEQPTTEELETWRRTTRNDLFVAVHYDRVSKRAEPGVREQMQNSFNAFLDDLDLEAELTFEGNSLRKRIYVRPRSIRDLCRLGVSILLDRDGEYHGRLRECRAEDCNRFVLLGSVRRPGAQKVFCSTSCRKRTAQANAVRRVQRHRKKKKRLQPKSDKEAADRAPSLPQR